MNAQSLLLHGPRQLRWVEEELPRLQSDEVLVQTIAGAISIGAELPQYLGIVRQAHAPQYPYMTGYESVGTVINCGDNVQSLRVGDRVVSFYGHRTHAILPETKAIPVPTAISNQLALLVILTCDVARGISKVALQTEEAIAITGGGAIGLLTAFMLLAQTPGPYIDIAEPIQHRQQLAQHIFSSWPASAVTISSAYPEEKTYAVGFECSSSDSAFAYLQDKMQPGGRICILSDGNKEALTLTPAFHEKELLIVGSSDGLDYQTHARNFFSLPLSVTQPLGLLFEWYTPASKLIDTFEALAGTVPAPLKVFVEYEESTEEIHYGYTYR